MQLRKNPNEWSGIICTSLGLHEVPPVVSETIKPVWATNKCANNNVGIGFLATIPVIVALGATNESLAMSVRQNGSSAVVNPVRIFVAKPHQIAHAHGVGPKDVVHLRLGKGHHLLGGNTAKRTVERLPHVCQIVGVHHVEERRRRHVLHVVPLAGVDKPPRGTINVAATLVRVLAQHRTQVVLRLLPVLPQRLHNSMSPISLLLIPIPIQ